MADTGRRYDYVAFDASGRRVRGQLVAASDDVAFQRLRRDGLSPVTIRNARAAKAEHAAAGTGLADRDTAAFLGDLAALLKAGTDMRAAFAILGARNARSPVAAMAKALSADIAGGGALDQAFTRRLPDRYAFVGALIAAGEAAGDLAGGCQRAAEILSSRVKLRDQLVSALSYPAFVAASTVAAVLVILLFVVPALAPLVEEAGSNPPVALSGMVAVSDVLRTHLVWIGGGLVLVVAGLLVAGRLGLLTAWWEGVMLDGPARPIARGIVYGAYAISLGNMLAAGAPMDDALRLATRTVRYGVARRRLEPLLPIVRQGGGLPTALEGVTGMPPAIIRMAAVGEVSGALGPMLARAGQLEEAAALRRIEEAGRILGPVLIVLLGALIGGLMAGLLSGVTSLGESALR